MQSYEYIRPLPSRDDVVSLDELFQLCKGARDGSAVALASHLTTYLRDPAADATPRGSFRALARHFHLIFTAVALTVLAVEWGRYLF